MAHIVNVTGFGTKSDLYVDVAVTRFHGGSYGIYLDISRHGHVRTDKHGFKRLGNIEVFAYKREEYAANKEELISMLPKLFAYYRTTISSFRNRVVDAACNKLVEMLTEADGTTHCAIEVHGRDTSVVPYKTARTRRPLL